LGGCFILQMIVAEVPLKRRLYEHDKAYDYHPKGTECRERPLPSSSALGLCQPERRPSQDDRERHHGRHREQSGLHVVHKAEIACPDDQGQAANHNRDDACGDWQRLAQ
jgi:hypothetical protein